MAEPQVLPLLERSYPGVVFHLLTYKLRIGDTMSENSGAGFIKYVAALGGFAVGWAVGFAIALNLAVPKESLLGRSAQAGQSPVGALLQWGLGVLGAVVAFLLVKGRVDR